VELRRRLELIAAFPDVQIDSPFGIAVVDGWGRDVFTLGADQPLLPASTNKLVVAAAAIQTFGPNQRFTTAVATTAPVDGNGVVEGDLVLIGGGDPALASPRFITEIYPARPHTPIAELVKAVQDAGITAVSGGVIAVPDIFARQLEPQGWVSSYYDRLEGTRTSGLTVDAGRRLFVRESDDALLGAAAKDPAVEAATVLRQLLIDAEIDVAGEPSLLETGVEPDVEVIGTVNSPPLSQMLSHMVKRSDNNMADTLFRLMGAIDSDGTWSGSSRAVRRALAPLELDWTGIALSDGSGLSRTDRLTASFLAHLDEAMMSTADADRWRALMAIAGESGTLRDRYRGTPAAGNMFGKTGALKDVRALAGSVDAPAPEGTTVAPERLHFAIVGSELDGKDIDRFRRLIDLLVLTLAAEQQGCDGWQAGGPDEDVQPESLVCAA
jgi:D-alanyl-D-alanine carboxypeptidase/D-alanyl-D-alanine-endopeptidase (penicillin-binding protein 4)